MSYASGCDTILSIESAGEYIKTRKPESHIPVQDEITRRGALVLRTLPILLIPLFVTAITFVLIRISVGSQFEPAAGGPTARPAAR